MTSDFDAIEHFALPVPVRAVSHLYQVSTKDIAQVKKWSVHVSGLIEPLPAGCALEDAEQSIAEFKAYLRGRLSEPTVQDCLPNRMSKILHDGLMDEDHVLANLILMFPAGHETTINLIGNGLYTLLRNPEQMAHLRRSPELIDKAVEEILRYEPPQQVAWRSVLADCEIGGKHIRKGEQLMMLLGAANRDPEVFSDPEDFDITRERNPHLSFGNSRHACLGAWFARMQGALALSLFVAEFSDVRLRAQKPAWYPTMSFHGLKSLPVSVG
jgi:cytochrome P450